MFIFPILGAEVNLIHKVLPAIRSVLTWRVVFLYSFALLLFTGLFVAAHYVANQVPQDFLAKRLSRDFRYHNLSRHNYPFSAHGSHSVLSNIGQNQYTECAVLLSVLSTPSDRLEDAVLPRTIKVPVVTACELLEKTVGSLETGGVKAETRPLRTRYWWGARPVYSYMLRFFSVYQIREMIRNVTSLAYTGLAVALLFISPPVFWMLLPLVIFGTLFSGISYYSEVPLGVPYLWAVIASALIAGLHAMNCSASRIYLAVFIVGMVSSFLWLLDGHLILLIAWLILISYFSSLRYASPANSLLSAIKYTATFSGGFLSAYFSGQVLKSLFTGFGPVIKSVAAGISYRTSNTSPGRTELDLSIVLDKVWDIGLWWTGFLRHELMWDVIVRSSVLAAITGIVICIVKGIRGNRRILVSLIICILVVLTILARLFFLQNHSVIHAFFIGRYMFIALAMGWVVLLVSLSGTDSSSFRLKGQ